MSDDLISRQAAIEVIFSEPLYESGMKKRDAVAVVPAIYEKIKSLPSAEPQRKTGKWRQCTDVIEETFHTGHRCSVCNYWKPMGIWNYCPNCGAKMEGDE